MINIIRITPAFLLFSLMLLLPQLYSEIKQFLMIFVIADILIKIYTKEIVYSKTVLFWFLFYFIFFTIWIIIGYFFNNPGVSNFVRLDILWPIIYLLLFQYIDNINKIYTLYKYLTIISLIICFYNIINMLGFLNIIPFFLNIDPDFAVGIHPGYIQIESLNLGTLVFLLPFSFMIDIFFDNFGFKIFKYQFNLFKINQFFLLLVVFFSGRRVLWFFLIALLSIRFILWFKKSKYKFFLITIFASLFFTISIYIFTILDRDSFLKRFGEEFSSTSQTDRQIQSIALLNGFKDNLLFGSGFGIGVPGVIRNYERPWTYELSYHIMLFNTGIIGFIIYITLLLFPLLFIFFYFKKHVKIFNLIAPTFVAYLFVLFANVIDPFLNSSFDFQWFLFLPICLINITLISYKKLNKIANA